MLNPTSLLVPQTSGFVPFGGGALDIVEPETAAKPRFVAAPVRTAEFGLAAPRPLWEAPASIGVRRVEMAVLAAIAGYFSFGLGGLLGLY